VISRPPWGGLPACQAWQAGSLPHGPAKRKTEARHVPPYPPFVVSAPDPCLPGRLRALRRPAAEDVDFGPVRFRLTERSGKEVTQDDLLGKVWVASFVFTRCMGPCPQVTGTVARLQSELSGQPGVRFVTFTVDPERDDPAELTRYANKFGADPDRWLFLTGKEADVYKLLHDGFKLPAQHKPGAKPGDEIEHSTRLAVVDRRGHVRAYFRGVQDPDDPGGKADFDDNLRRLGEKAAALAREAP
jgi:protein SCO1